MRIAIIGAGVMGKAIIDALKPTDFEIIASNRHGGQYNGISIGKDNKAAAAQADAVFLCVKPQIMDEVLNEIKDDVRGKLVITIAAGLKITFYEKRADARFVRVMTNLAVRDGQGISLYFLGSKCTKEDKTVISELLNPLGEHIQVQDEKMLSIATGTSGSAIAYLLRVAGVFVDAAKEKGMPKTTAEQLVTKTLIGAASLMETGSYDSEALVMQIASKGGTTEQGLRVLQENNLKGILQKVIDATISKSEKMGEENE